MLALGDGTFSPNGFVSFDVDELIIELLALIADALLDLLLDNASNVTKDVLDHPRLGRSILGLNGRSLS
jgi:hypothetical protein